MIVSNAIKILMVITINFNGAIGLCETRDSLSLESIFFCAVCVPVKLEIAEIEGLPPLEKSVTEQVDFFRLKPKKVYWGSLETAKPSLAVHPLPKDSQIGEVLVVLRENIAVLDEGWIKGYFPISKKRETMEYYGFEGKVPINSKDLDIFLEEKAKFMRTKFPLDVDRFPDERE